MRRPPARTPTIACLIVGAGLLLTACDVSGTVTVNPDATVTVDTVVTHGSDAGDGPCRDADGLSDYGITGEVLPAPAGKLSCRFTGTLERHRRVDYLYAMLGRGDGRFHLMVPGGLIAGGAEELTGLDVTFVFPGPVLEAASATQVSGRTARWTDVRAVADTGILAVALDHPDVHPTWVVAALAATIGAAAGVGATLLVRRRTAGSHPDPVAGEPDPQSAAADDVVDRATTDGLPPAAPRAARTEDPSVWAPDDRATPGTPG